MEIMRTQHFADTNDVHSGCSCRDTEVNVSIVNPTYQKPVPIVPLEVIE